MDDRVARRPDRPRVGPDDPVHVLGDAEHDGAIGDARALQCLLGLLDRSTRFECRLHGSLAATGIGRPDAVIAGLRGYEPETVDPALADLAALGNTGYSLPN
ncbi:serine dehydratase beta chain [Agromyces soli]